MNRSKNVAFTTFSKGYLSYGRTLRDSFKEHNPNTDFFFAIVDELNGEINIEDENCEVIGIKDIGVENFDSYAFKYDVLELNTAVKYFFTRYLKEQRGYEKVMYIDADVRVYNNMDFIYDLLDKHSFLLTPHITKPYPDDLKPNQQDITKGGTHNLGWYAIGNSKESEEFLDWMEGIVKKISYTEPRMGLFTDQKQQDLAFSLFDNGLLLKDLGCNMAYWNLHERKLTKKDGKFYVNDKTPLTFFHFSGLDLYSDSEIAAYQNRYDLSNRPDLVEIFAQYRKEMLEKGYEKYIKLPYSFNYYSNGEKITSMARKLYAANLDKFENVNPFDADGAFYKWAKERHLLDNSPEVKGQSTMTLDKGDKRLKAIHFALRALIRVFGANKYSALMKYLSYISVERNQKDIFK
jgi:hypothetical protein